MRLSQHTPHGITTSAVGNIARLAYALALRKGADVEFWIAAVIRACREITRRHVTVKSITFAHPRKPTPELNRFFGSKITFGADVDEVTFSPSIKRIPVVSADTYLNDLLVHYCEKALADQRNRGLFGTSAENAIAVLLPHGKARRSEVARKLGLTQRTLARRLSSET
jgi:hypothetical protein